MSDFDLDKAPFDMGQKEICAAAAHEILGCRIRWWPLYHDWCCACPGTPHGCDQQCSALMDELQLWLLIVPEIKKLGLEVPGDEVPTMLRHALVEWRKLRLH